MKNENSKDNNSYKNIKRKKTIKNEKSFNKYFIIISNYDEELKFKNSQKKRSVNIEQLIKNKFSNGI